MVTMTINVPDAVATAFRDAVKRKRGEGKGILGKAVEEALQQWVYEKNQRAIAERQIALMRKGIGNLKGWKFNRGELYDRIR